jgi:hypothetical protein
MFSIASAAWIKALPPPYSRPSAIDDHAV